MPRWTRFAACLAIGLVGCAHAGADPQHRPGVRGPADLLLVTTSEGLELISTSGEVVATIPNGVASSDSSILVSSEARDGTTVLRRFDRAGRVLTKATVSGRFAPLVISPSGDLVAIGEAATPASSPYLPAGRTTTNLGVVDAGGRTRAFHLRGNFEPEAFSTADDELYLIEYVPAAAPTRYRVRRLLLDSGRVRPIGRLKTAAPGQMQGTGRTQVYSPYRAELYTLYTQQKDAGHDGQGVFEGDHAFVHLLNLDEGWTHCIDLPETFGSGRATASAIAVTSGGTHLFVADWTSGVVADAEPAKLRVVRSAAVDFGAPDGETFARATATRLYVAGGSDVVALDAADLEISARWSAGEEIRGLALSEDQRRLYVALAGRILVLDASNGDALDEIDVPEATGIVDAKAPL